MAKYLIIGGVAGGATAAARLRRIDEKAEIIMFERGEHISYANCGLPYYIGGVIKEREKLLLQTPESFNKRLNVDVRVCNEVISIHPEDNKVSIKDLKTGKTYQETYDKLIVSPGAEPVKPPIEGFDLPEVFTLRNVNDTDKIKNFCDQKQPKRATVIGAGFIGLEMAENFHHIGLEVNIVEKACQVMTPVDFEIAAGVHQHIKEQNVGLYLSESVTKLEKVSSGIKVHLESGNSFETDVVILSVGVRPETSLIKDANLAIAPNGGIQVNDYLQTSNPDVYAVGDAIAFIHPITGQYCNTYLAGPANLQGRIVADNIVKGNKRKYKGALATAIAKVFDLTVASVGLNETQLKKNGIGYKANIIHGGSHAGYYPGAINLTLKLLFSPEDGKVLGAQAIGYDGIDKRIDMIASIMLKGGDIYDLQEIEQSYAPPYSSAKDPVNQAGFAAENIIEKKVNTIDWRELSNLDTSSVFLLDVRTKDEFSLGAIPNSINIDVDDLRNHINNIPKDKKIIIFCGVGLRGYIAARILMQNGFNDVYNLSGGLKIYQQATAVQSHIICNEDSSSQVTEIQTPTQKEHQMSNKEVKVIEVDACGLQCPGPILKLKQEVEKLDTGDRIKQIATDAGFKKDVQSWCNLTGNKLISLDAQKGVISALIEKGQSKEDCPVNGNVQLPKDKTLVVFSDDMDKALASFVIANGAAATGRKVTMFFTFWGLNTIKKRKKPRVKKDFMGFMFGKMMAAHSGKLNLSKMNMMGMGSIMMKKRMKAKNVDSLETLIQAAMDNGVEMMACQMSMDVMGVDASELLDGVKIGGVASYMEAADTANHNLFI
ncbi:MAG: CoA-disulfide reductase [Hyphomicrobiales bacterium]